MENPVCWTDLICYHLVTLTNFKNVLKTTFLLLWFSNSYFSTGKNNLPATMQINVCAFCSDKNSKRNTSNQIKMNIITLNLNDSEWLSTVKYFDNLKEGQFEHSLGMPRSILPEITSFFHVVLEHQNTVITLRRRGIIWKISLVIKRIEKVLKTRFFFNLCGNHPQRALLGLYPSPLLC